VKSEELMSLGLFGGFFFFFSFFLKKTAEFGHRCLFEIAAALFLPPLKWSFSPLPNVRFLNVVAS
jgi:hypothetical protein